MHLFEVQGTAKQLPREALLQFYMEEWDRYTVAILMINYWFSYAARQLTASTREPKDLLPRDIGVGSVYDQ
jgi:hypothetical protein